MASVRSTIELLITGSTRGLNAASTEARRMAERVAAAEDRVSDARRRSAEASSRVAEAEARLNRARATGNPDAIAAASERLARARGQEFAASENLARAENALNAVRRRGTDDMNRQRSGILGVFDAFSRLSDAFTGADGASTSLLSKLSALNSVITSIGGPIAQAVVGLLEFAAVAGAIGEIVGVVGGLIGQALAGAPALLLAVAAAAGTVALGMDGIKKAAEVLQAPFDKLKKAVSDAFVLGLTPAFKQLAAALPQFTDGFKAVALALSGIANQVIGFVTSARGIADINGILLGTRNLLQAVAPGLRTFVQGLLDAANIGGPAFTALGTAISSVFATLGNVFTRLAGDGTIAKAVQGLAATITGLGAVIGPIIELLIRMGAALGDSVGVALQDVGSAITQVTPFFEHLAKVAGDLLVEAFKQLGPPIRELIDSILPGANQGLDGFAALVKDTVLPAIAGFINWLRTDGIPGVVAFTKSAIAQFLQFAQSAITAVDGILATLQGLFTALASFPNPFQAQAAAAAAAIATARGELDKTKATLATLESKTIAFTVQVPSDRTTGEQGVLGVAAAMDRAPSRESVFKVNVPSDRTTGEQGILGVVAAQERVQPKTVTVTANVPSGPTTGTLGNQVLEGAIGAVINKSVTTTSNVPGSPVVGTQGNQALTGAIGQVRDKTTTTKTNVIGTDKVNELKGAIALVKDKTVTVTVQVKGAGAIPKFAAGGRVPTSGAFLVGEKGPELLTLDAFGGVVTPAAKTEQLLTAERNRRLKAAALNTAPTGSGEAPITVNVMLSQDQIAGIAQAEIVRQNRATKRTVLAGSGVTF